jgi:hypothetical protein
MSVTPRISYQPNRAQPRRGRTIVTTVARLFGVAGIGLVIWFFYGLAAALVGVHPSCDFSILPTYEGGQATQGSMLTAALLGASLWCAAGVGAAVRRGRGLAAVTGAFVAAYVLGLTVLWLVSPLIWGPRVWVC